MCFTCVLGSNLNKNTLNPIEKVLCSRNVVTKVGMLSRNVIGWPELLLAAHFKRNRIASADWLPADAVGGSICVVIGPFIACSSSSSVLGAGPLFQMAFTPVPPSAYPTVSSHLSIYSSIHLSIHQTISFHLYSQPSNFHLF